MTRSSFRDGRTSERGFALILALVLGVLYFGFIELLMLDASRELAEARRFRGRIVALTLAENAAELAAIRIVDKPAVQPPMTDEQGTMTGTVTITGEGRFDLLGTGRSVGREGTEAWVRLEGKITGNRVIIEYSRHSQ